MTSHPSLDSGRTFNETAESAAQIAAADRLLQRPASAEYLQEWETYVSSHKASATGSQIVPVVIFRIGKEFLALSTAVVGQVTETKAVHRIPHQRGRIVRGLVNINGRLRLFVGMSSLLEIDSANSAMDTGQKHSMMVLEKESDVWAFEVSEVCGVYHCELAQLHNVPVNVAKSTANYLKGVFVWNGNSAGYLDDDLLVFSLRKSLL
jgi:chemotaxis-related protein WspD